MPCSQAEEEGRAMGVLQPAARWERSQSGRLFAFEWSLRGIAAAPAHGRDHGLRGQL
jgi:hypothetical protein